MEQLIIRTIKNALGSHVHYFDIRLDDVHVDDEDYYSATFSFQPKQMDHWEDCKVIGKTHPIQFDVDGEDVTLVIGEGSHLEVSAATIYSSLYWSEATEAA